MTRKLDSKDFAWAHLASAVGPKIDRPVANLQDVFQGDLGSSIYLVGATTVHKILGTINRVHHLQLLERHVKNAVISEDAEYFTLEMYRYAKRHEGSVKIKISRIPLKADLGQTITTTEYSGLLLQLI